MTIQERAFFGPMQHPDGGTITFFQVYDDVGRPNQPDRWRVKAIKIVNTTPASYCAYVHDPASGPDAGYYPAPCWDTVNRAVVPSGQTQQWDVPLQYQNRNPDDFDWGGSIL